MAGKTSTKSAKIAKKAAAKARHGFFEDVLSTDPAFFRRIESLYAGHDFACTDEEVVHNHGASSIETGRGSP